MNMAHELDDLIRMTAQEVYGPEMDDTFEEDEAAADLDVVDGWSVGFPSDFVVVGHNPENADMSNPRGEIVRERWYILAEDAKGNRRVWGGLYDSPEAAEAAYSLEAPPIDLWDETQPCYGSEAYQDGDWEQDQIEREREEDLNGPYFIVTRFV
jgi:hypothetical protein